MEKGISIAEDFSSMLRKRKEDFSTQRQVLERVRRTLKYEEDRIKRLEGRTECTIRLLKKMMSNQDPEFREKCERIYYRFELGNTAFDVDTSVLDELRYEVTRVDWTPEQWQQEENIERNRQKKLGINPAEHSIK